MRIHAAFKIEHIDAWFCLILRRIKFGFRLRLFSLLLMLFLLRFQPQFLLMVIQQRQRHLFLHLFILFAQAGNA